VIRTRQFGIIVILSISGLFLTIPSAEAVLWDLIITVNLEKNPLEVNEKPVIIGTVMDHAGKGVSDVEVKIRFDTQSVVTTTNATGNFRYESDFEQSQPGRYIINVQGTDSDNRIGLAKTDFLVNGQQSIPSQLLRNAELMNLAKYEFEKPENFENDPVGLMMYKYYQEIREDIIEEQNKINEIEELQKFINEQRVMADILLQEAIDERNPGGGTYSGYTYDRFISNLDDEVRDIIVDQLNYTTNRMVEAEKEMNIILQSGGTYEEARQAYFEKASISREIMNDMTVKINKTENMINTQESNTTNAFEGNTNDSINGTDYRETTNTKQIFINGTSIEVGFDNTTLYVNINGTLVKLVLNGTEISYVSSSQD